jgi:DNA-binding response OmpR family regulator
MSLTQERDLGTGSRLTRKEKDLLELLEKNPGRCFSRSYLLKRIWGYSSDARTRTVDVHVSRLRKKLEGRGDVIIHTVVRQGYILQKAGDLMDLDGLNGGLAGDPERYGPPKLVSSLIA